jgi:hypothetical protein
MKRKLIVGLLALVGAASGGCFVAVEDEYPRHHVHCEGCGHVYVHGTWR